ncbi:MAG: carboxylesterase family protein [Deltaproteobacteria bacterium]|jgi:para-nitrobenzyl esterase|nr:carboxylesterase family protein [Deltaproteobacteria bacterium]
MSDRRTRDRFEQKPKPTRWFFSLALILSLLASLASCSKAPITPPTVEAGGESLLGVHLDPEGTLTVFRGIPYAAPPVGRLRWQPPEPHVARAGLQDASRFGAACPQLQGNPEWYRDVAEKFGRSRDEIPDLTNIAEDCLFLNVWSQNLGGEIPQPVMVWIHGGGNVNGFSHEPNYRGYNLAKRGVVVVSINYRLGALGFMAHPALTAESALNISGNYGLFDQIAALKWVRDNIANFGGDPDRVTLFGESAGAANIGTLIASPLARGLFRRAIIQSGGYPLYDTTTVGDAEEAGVKLMSALGVGDGPARLGKMRALKWQQIFAEAQNAEPGSFSRALVDGWLLPRPAAEIFAAGQQNPTEIVIGSNANEWLMYLAHPVDDSALHATLKQRVREGNRAEVLAALNKAVSGDVTAKLDLLTGALDFHCPSLALAEAQRRVTNHVYVYRFTRVRPGGEKLLAYHGAEIPYVFDTADHWLPADEVDWALTETMLGYWSQFAKTGDPNAEGLPEWPRFDAKSGAHQELGDEVRAATGLEREFCEVLDRSRI